MKHQTCNDNHVIKHILLQQWVDQKLAFTMMWIPPLDFRRLHLDFVYLWCYKCIIFDPHYLLDYVIKKQRRHSRKIFLRSILSSIAPPLLSISHHLHRKRYRQRGDREERWGCLRQVHLWVLHACLVHKLSFLDFTGKRSYIRSVGRIDERRVDGLFPLLFLSNPPLTSPSHMLILVSLIGTWLLPFLDQEIVMYR